MTETGLPLLISSGMSSWEELDRTVEFVKNKDAAFGVFQCTTSYPCPPEKWGLNVLEQMKKRYDCPIGLSDHSGTIYPGLAAVTLGATLLEFHVAFSKIQFGPDASASLTMDQARELVAGVHGIKAALQNPIDKNKQATEFEPLHELFTKSIVAKTSLSSGQELTADDLAFKKPGIGIPASEVSSIIGKKLVRDVEKDCFFQLDDFLN